MRGIIIVSLMFFAFGMMPKPSMATLNVESRLWQTGLVPCTLCNASMAWMNATLLPSLCPQLMILAVDGRGPRVSAGSSVAPRCRVSRSRMVLGISASLPFGEAPTYRSAR